ncbi:MAG: hypothetical protein ACLFQK_05140 [Fibrobacterota bacterium]
MPGRIVITLVVLTAIISGIAAFSGVLSEEGSGSYIYKSIRGQEVEIYGRGLYRHMSSDVAVQGIAQDWVTLLLGIPAMLISLIYSLKGSLRGRTVLSGILFYFFVTYLFYTAMGMYNIMFPAYISLMGLSFFAFTITLMSGNPELRAKRLSRAGRRVKAGGFFLIINSCLIFLLWLQVILPPLFDGTIYPEQLHHYTTLIVQGFDLGLLLPMGIVSGVMAVRGKKYGFLFTPVYLVFLTLLMAALTSKVIFMARTGQNVIPVIFIMPSLCLTAAFFSFRIISCLKENPGQTIDSRNSE